MLEPSALWGSVSGLPNPSSLAVRVWSEGGKEEDVHNVGAGKADSIVQGNLPKTLSWNGNLHICKIDASSTPVFKQPNSREWRTCSEKEKGRDPESIQARETIMSIVSHRKTFISTVENQQGHPQCLCLVLSPAQQCWQKPPAAAVVEIYSVMSIPLPSAKSDAVCEPCTVRENCNPSPDACNLSQAFQEEKLPGKGGQILGSSLSG